MIRCLILMAATPLLAAAADRTPAPLPADRAAKQAVLPDGFRMSVFAAEPDITQPISFAIDSRGRLWVVEATNYGEWKPTGRDRVVILEDADGDGRAEKRTVFYEGFNYATGIEVGFGGAWIMSPPGLYFIPDRDGNDKPDGPPEVVLDGFGYKESRHNLANGFTWGPDGWLYGGHGRTSPSDVGRPGTPPGDRVHCDGGVFRVHPARLTFETFADGTTNPWGVDFDRLGECFVSNCVTPHLYHMIQGGHYEPWRNRPSSRYAYERLPTIADHLHYPGGKPSEMRGETAQVLALGGGHAHCGTLVYRGGAFPPEYDNAVLMCNIHGRRINHDILNTSGSGYVASHGKDFMLAADPWFMGVTLRTGPDGSVFVSDWSDTGECHTYTPDRSSGRIYKISYHGGGKKTPSPPVDLTTLTDLELVQRHDDANDYFARHARRILQERAARPGWNGETARAAFRQLAFDAERKVESRLLGLWGLHVTGGVPPGDSAKLLQAHPPHLRAWTIRLLCERAVPDDSLLSRFQSLARNDPSPVVRLALASALQRLPLAKRWAVAGPLLAHPEDAADANLPLMSWYAVEPLVPADPDRALTLGIEAGVPLVRRFIARRVVDYAAEKGDQADLSPLVAALDRAGIMAIPDLLRGARDGLAGRKSVMMPRGWPTVYAKLRECDDPQVRQDAVVLALIFGDPQALTDLRKVVTDRAEPPANRTTALEALIDRRVAGLAPLLHDLLGDPATRRTALRGLATAAHPATPARVLAAYPALTPEEKADAVATLTSRKDYALALLDAVEKKQVPRGDVSAYAARQIFALGDARVRDRLRQVWGEVRETSPDRRKQLARYEAILTPRAIETADAGRGRAVFARTCQQCHRLHGEGGTVGPDLTGSNRTDLDYLLQNLIDPSAEVGRDFRMSVVQTTDGRVVTGILAERSPARVVVQTATDRVTLSPDDVESVTDSPLSIMPEGQLDALTRQEVRDLFAYLTGKAPPP